MPLYTPPTCTDVTPLDCAVDSVTICPGDDPIVVTGTVALDAGTLAALETITVNQGTSPWVIGDGGGSITVDGSITADTNFDYAEDSPHTTGEVGAFVLAVRNDANASMTTTNGDYSPIAVNANGAVAITDGGNSITVDGTVAVTQSTSPWVTSLDAGTLAALESITVQNGAGGAAVNIQDGGNSITVDGTVSISGTVTVDTELPAASALADADPNPTTSRIGANNLVYNGTTWDRVRSGTATGSLLVNNPTAANLLATVTIDAGSLAALESITVQNGAGAGAVNIQDGGNSITVDGAVTVSGTVATNAERAEDSAHTTGQIGNFVLGVRNDAAATRTDTDGDYSPISTDSAGRVGISDLGGSITVDGTVAVTQSTSPWVTSLDAASLSALESITVQNGAGAAAVNIQDGGNSITVDGTVSISGTVTTNPADNKLEDDPHSSGATGSFVLAVRNDAGTPLAANGDYIPFTMDSNGDLYVTTGRNGSIANGAETTVTNAAAQILAANTARKKYIVQNTGTANIRVGITGVTATTGFRLVPGGSMVIEMPNCPTNAIFAIREGATNSIAFAQEIT